MRPKEILLIIFLGIFTQNVSAQVCNDPINIIYGVKKNGDVVPINVNNAILGTPLTSSSDPGYPGFTRAANGIGLDIQSKTFYYFQNNLQSTQKFVSFDGVTNTYQTLANSPIKGYSVKGCISQDGTGFYCIDSASTLCYYSILSNTWAQISSNIVDQFNNSLAATFSTLGNGDMVIDGLGNLWIVAASPSNWGLYKLDAPLPTTPLPSITLNEMVPPTQATPSGLPFVGIAYDPTGQIYMCTVNDLYLLRNDLSITHVNSFSKTGVVVDLTSCNYPFQILSLSIENFSASLYNNNSALLSWFANQQINTTGYYIERSIDGARWDSIGYQPAVNNFSKTSYQFTDDHPGYGVNYYRVRILFDDGVTSYSSVKGVNITAAGTVKIWPTQVHSYINIEVPSANGSKCGTVTIFNSSGQQIANNLLSGGINKIDVSSIPAGYYIVHIILLTGDAISSKIMRW